MARALAQTHPLSAGAYRYRTRFIEMEKLRQPNTDVVDWASNSVLVGYCLRRVEEAAFEQLRDVITSDLDVLASRAGAIGEILRSEDAGTTTLLDGNTIVTALDRLIATELEKRWDTAHEHATPEDWKLFEDYLAWSVVHGYCLRTAETQ